MGSASLAGDFCDLCFARCSTAQLVRAQAATQLASRGRVGVTACSIDLGWRAGLASIGFATRRAWPVYADR